MVPRSPSDAIPKIALQGCPEIDVIRFGWSMRRRIPGAVASGLGGYSFRLEILKIGISDVHHQLPPIEVSSILLSSSGTP